MIYWEEIEQSTGGSMYRTKVPTGWLIKEVQEVMHNFPDRGLDNGYDWTSTLTFVPDPTHSWEV